MAMHESSLSLSLSLSRSVSLCALSCALRWAADGGGGGGSEAHETRLLSIVCTKPPPKTSRKPLNCRALVIPHRYTHYTSTSSTIYIKTQTRVRYKYTAGGAKLHNRYRYNTYLLHTYVPC